VVAIHARHIQDGGGRHFEKTVKSPYLCNRLTDIDEIWHADADWPPTGGISLKFSIFQKKMAAVAILKNHKNCDITASDWPIFAKFGTIMQNGLLTIQTVEKFAFPKSKMADGRHFKNR